MLRFFRLTFMRAAAAPTVSVLLNKGGDPMTIKGNIVTEMARVTI